MSFKDKIRARRLELGMTTDDVAKLVGVSNATISRWETGVISNQRRDKIELLAAALQTTPSILMGWADNDNNPSDDYSVLFRANLNQELEIINPQDFNGVGEAEADYQFLTHLLENNNPITLADACRAADSLGCSLDELVWGETKKSPDVDIPISGEERKLIGLVRQIHPQQRMFLWTWLKTTVEQGQETVPVVPLSSNGKV